MAVPTARLIVDDEVEPLTRTACSDFFLCRVAASFSMWDADGAVALVPGSRLPLIKSLFG